MGRWRFEAVLFDLFETLITEYQQHWRPELTPAARLGIGDETFDQVWRVYVARRMTQFVDYRTVLRDACRVAGSPIDDRMDSIISELYSERLAAKAKPLLQVEEPVIDLLKRLRSMGLRLGLVSNCSADEVAAWTQSPLGKHFDDVVFSYRVGYAKPDARIYELACQRLRVRPRQCAFVGDGGSDELSGAARTGLSPFCARWFLDRWPVWRSNRNAERDSRYPQVASVAELISLLSGNAAGI